VDSSFESIEAATAAVLEYCNDTYQPLGNGIIGAL